MEQTTLDQLQNQIDQLDLLDRVRLLQFLAPRIAEKVLPHAHPQEDAQTAWQRFREVGKHLAETSLPGSPSLTQAVSDVRR